MGLINASLGWHAHRDLAECRRAAHARRQRRGSRLVRRDARELAAADAHWGEPWQKWWSAQPRRAASRPGRSGVRPRAHGDRRPAQLGHWEIWGEPALAVVRRHGLVSRAREAQRRAGEAGGDARRSDLIDDVDLVWVNGRAMASGFGEEQRAYALPREAASAGDNLVVVNVFDMWGNGGLRGPADKLRAAVRGRHHRAARRHRIPAAAGGPVVRRARRGSRSPASTFSTTA